MVSVIGKKLGKIAKDKTWEKTSTQLVIYAVKLEKDDLIITNVFRHVIIDM